MQQFLELCKDIGCPVALEKTEWAALQVVFLCILLDGTSFTLSVPEDKRRKAVVLLNWVTNRRTITIKIIQRLTGTLNFLSKAIVPGRTYTRMMYKKLKIVDKEGNKLKQYHHVTVDASFKEDCRIWKLFLSKNLPSLLCRPFVNLDEHVYATTLNFYMDASLNKNYGIGGIFGNRYFVARWTPGFIATERPSIEFAELLALTAGILTMGNCRSYQTIE